MKTIGEKLEALYMLPGISKKDYDLLEPCMNLYGVGHHADRLTEKHVELILMIWVTYFEV